MRQARVKIEGDGYYHVTSRCALQEFLMESRSKDMFVRMMRRAADFSGVEIITYCVMDNHFHILLKVPGRKDVGVDELKRRIVILYGEAKAKSIFDRWKAFDDAGERERVQGEQDAFRKRMYDLSEFGKTLKQRYSVWYRANHERGVGNAMRKEERVIEGTIWQGRFHSVVVEPTQKALTAVAAYIDMNPVRAGIVEDASLYRWSGYGEPGCGGSGVKTDRRPVDAVLYKSILEEKTSALVAKIPSLSRGLAVGAAEFVAKTICKARGVRRSRTVVVPLADDGCIARLCFAGRRKKNA